LSDQTHMEELKTAVSVPLHQKLLETFTKMVRDPETGAADYTTGLKNVLEQQLAVGDADAATRPHD
jgi:hypothetical protein